MSKQNAFLTADVIAKTTPFLKNVLENTPPYKETALKYPFGDILKTLTTSPKLNLFCTTCCEKKTFLSKYATLDDGILYKKLFDGAVNDATDKAFISLGYKCADCEAIYYFTLLLDKERVKKVGQYPSFAELSYHDLEKYKNVMSKYYIEYKQSLSAYSQKMGVASFVYLRRILEDIVNKKYNELEEQNPQDKFIDRLKAVEKIEEIIPNEISKIKGKIYSVLSKGVHEYSESECLELYDAVRFIIELILDKQLEKKNRREKTKNVVSTILEKAGQVNE